MLKVQRCSLSGGGGGGREGWGGGSGGVGVVGGAFYFMLKPCSKGQPLTFLGFSTLCFNLL